MKNFKPTDIQCPVCETVFLQPVRRQGGGRRSIYCSPRCRSLDWARGNPTKRQATVLAYESLPENKKKKQASGRAARLRAYGISEAEAQLQLVRQGSSCYGCLEHIDEKTARIDHSHTTGKVRGLLCDHCNWSLGHAKDNPMTLRRLMAYLDYQRDKMCVYLGGSMRNHRVPEIGNLLRNKGLDVMDEWHTPGELADENWQKYEAMRGRNYPSALRGRSATNSYSFDRAYMDHCDVFVLVMPAGKSAFLELGYMKGRGKHTVLFLDGTDPDRFDIMPNFVDDVVSTEDELVGNLTADAGWTPRGTNPTTTGGNE